MASINNLQTLTTNLLPTNTSVNSFLDGIADQSASVLTNLGESFSELLYQSQNSRSDEETNTNNEPILALTAENVSDNLGTMQNELLASLLGYNSGVTALASSQSALSNINDFSLDSYKESMQESVLGVLQANSIVSTLTQLTEGEELTTDSRFVNDLARLSFNEDGIGIEDAFDVLNVLEHIPVVSSIYQSVTEQENIGVVSQLAGDFLYGGPVGLAYSALNLAVESFTGTSINDAIVEFDYSSFIFPQDDTEVVSTDVADKPTLFFDKYNQLISTRN